MQVNCTLIIDIWTYVNEECGAKIYLCLPYIKEVIFAKSCYIYRVIQNGGNEKALKQLKSIYNFKRYTQQIYL